MIPRLPRIVGYRHRSLAWALIIGHATSVYLRAPSVGHANDSLDSVSDDDEYNP